MAQGSTPHRVAVLDDYQGLSVSHFDTLDKAVFDVTVFRDTLLPWNHPDTPQHVKEALVHRLEPFHVICTMRERTPFPRDLIARLPNLKLLLTTGLRNNSLDLGFFKEQSIPVAGTADKSTGTQVGTNSTTEHCVTLVLALARGIARDDAAVKAGLWQTGFATGLTGKTFAVVGLGRLGVATAKILRMAFGMRIIAWSQNLTQEIADEKAKSAGFPVEDPSGEKTFKVVSREELFSEADVLSVHLVLSDRTRDLIKADDLNRMKKNAFLINTSRGPLIHEGDLLAILKKGAIQGAALDVYGIEPLPTESEWRTTKWGEDGRSQVLLTPHMGYVEPGTLNAWYGQQVDNVKRWHEGDVLVNPLA
ncbi:hypothetical protein VD0004_g1912 [Verticillium dahliae]|uniref:D-isomer specific 2-hydroxyacid dehydrogenase NAD-binding domain-containing protein n=1 Tax=Verticillium dahliae TaxID=27337 RepID=A0A444RPI6_VERDA|nr:hypothetical protein VdG1_02605 [Verticillium dahliae VDG1]PNH46104.1 hypothetical protein VD0004_g1912 [Verticillium dahliae]PNH72181.1 hypothetical protein VD0001_g5364 [Verticillium dahliae]RXG43038.1 hypothetical protein VDGE_06177 [Verticillium dahliae]